MQNSRWIQALLVMALFLMSMFWARNLDSSFCAGTAGWNFRHRLTAPHFYGRLVPNVGNWQTSRHMQQILLSGDDEDNSTCSGACKHILFASVCFAVDFKRACCHAIMSPGQTWWPTWQKSSQFLSSFAAGH